MFPMQRERSVAVQAVSQAARICQTIRAGLCSGETMVKEDCSPVTIADFSSQAVICFFLRNAFPDDPVVAEENAADLVNLGDPAVIQRVVQSVQIAFPDAQEENILAVLNRGNYAGGPQGRFWTLDPIDGTKGFLRSEQYAVSLSLIENGQIKLGILGCPNYQKDGGKGFLFVAVRGQGAYRMGLDDPHEHSLAVSRCHVPAEAVFCESVEAAHTAQSDMQRILERLGVSAAPLRIDSQCKYAAVACADASVYLRLPTRAGYEEKIWDHAAGCLVLSEAGGRITDLHGVPLDFSQGRTLSRNQGIVATNGRLHGAVLGAIQSVLS